MADVMVIEQRVIRFEQWGRNLASIRKLNGYPSQRSLAQALGVSKSAVQFWESGAVPPRDEMKARIAGLLNVEVRTLFPIEPSKP